MDRDQTLKEAIEKYLDTHPMGDSWDALDSVFAHIADLCREKADHVRTNWQDEGLAHVWERYGKACDKARESYDKAASRID